MDLQHSSTESKLPLLYFNGNFFQDQEDRSQSSNVLNCRPSYKIDSDSQLEEPFFVRLFNSIFFYFQSDSKLNESGISLENRVEEIEKRLDSGWYFYKLWLSFVMITAPLCGVFLSGNFFFYWDDTDGDSFKILSVLMGFALGGIFWAVKQARLQSKALKIKDFSVAAKAYNSLVRFAVYYFILVLTVLCLYLFKRDYYSGIIGYFCLEFARYYVIPVWIGIYGSYRVKALLEEKKDLICKNGKSEADFAARKISQKYNVILL